MTAGTGGAPFDDRRAGIVAAVLVGAVVVVLGFGSGAWSELVERSAGSSATGRDLGTVVQGGPVAVDAAPGEQPATETLATRFAPTAGGNVHVTSTTADPAAVHTPVPAVAEASPSTTAVEPEAPIEPDPACSAGSAAPFWTHLKAAHLETSPGQQVADALALDQYVKTHTVLIEAMLAPVVEAVVGTAEHPSAFWAHLKAAHLEASPGQQVADALALDQYVRTHTVLVEDIAAPIVGTC